MKFYELSFLINPELNEKEANEVVQGLVSFLQEKGGILDNLQEIKMLNLAYLIEKKPQAFFSSFTFYFKPEEITALEKALKGNKAILRYLLVTRKKPRIITAVKPPIEKKKKIKEKKVDLKKIEEKLDEILAEEINKK